MWESWCVWNHQNCSLGVAYKVWTGLFGCAGSDLCTDFILFFFICYITNFSINFYVTLQILNMVNLSSLWLLDRKYFLLKVIHERNIEILWWCPTLASTKPPTVCYCKGSLLVENDNWCWQWYWRGPLQRLVLINDWLWVGSTFV